MRLTKGVDKGSVVRLLIIIRPLVSPINCQVIWSNVCEGNNGMMLEHNYGYQAWCLLAPITCNNLEVGNRLVYARHGALSPCW
jgi:hypothetical protein